MFKRKWIGTRLHTQTLLTTQSLIGNHFLFFYFFIFLTRGVEQYGHFKALTLLTLRFIFDLHEITAEITNCICRSKKNPYYEIQVETHSKTNHHNMHYWSHYLYVDSVLHIKIGLNFSIQILYPTTNLHACNLTRTKIYINSSIFKLWFHATFQITIISSNFSW